MKTWTLGFAAVLAAWLWAPAAVSGPRDMAFSVTRLGGDTDLAQPWIDQFLRYLESDLGLPAGAAGGAFLPSRRAVLAFVDRNRPGVGILDPPLYYEMRETWDLVPILQVESPDLVSRRLHVVVKDPAIRSLADLEGRRIWTTLADYPRYVERVVLDGQVDASRLHLKPIGQAQKGVRAVIRGDADATFLDDEQWARSRELPGGEALRDLFASPDLPSIPVVVFGNALPAADRAALVRTLTAMCQTPRGGAICRSMFIGRFVPVDPSAFGDTGRRFGE